MSMNLGRTRSLPKPAAKARRYRHGDDSFVVSRAEDGLNVHINGDVQVMVRGRQSIKVLENQLKLGIKVFDFIKEYLLVDDVLVGGRQVSEDEAVRVLEKIRGEAAEPFRRKALVRNLVHQRLFYMKPGETKTFTMASTKTELEVRRKKSVLDVNTKIGLTARYDPSHEQERRQNISVQNNTTPYTISLFTDHHIFIQNLAFLLTDPEDLVVEDAKSWLLTASVLHLKRNNRTAKIAIDNPKKLEMLGKCVAYEEDPTLAILVGHYKR